MKKGFSLLEVMVAVSILAISLLAMVNFQGQTMVRIGRAEKVSLATMLARSKISETILQIEKEWAQQKVFPEDKSEEGKFEEPFEQFRWEWQIRKVTLPTPGGGEGSPFVAIFKIVNDQLKENIREMKLVVKWEDRGKERHVDFVTHITKL